MKKKSADIEDILATFSSHIKKSYPSPGQFRDNLTRLLEDKKKRIGDERYSVSLERNVVFLHDLVMEGEALLEIVLGADMKKTFGESELNTVLVEMENKVRGQTEKRHREIFVVGNDAEFRELLELKEKGKSEYMEKLEFNYRYLMTLRLLLFEFFNVVISIRSEYRLKKISASDGKRVFNHLDLTANYYLGNVKVGEGKPVN